MSDEAQYGFLFMCSSLKRATLASEDRERGCLDYIPGNVGSKQPVSLHAELVSCVSI